jgi:dTDP-4-amino-4,6-dideoxygalactose transaminase
VVPDPAPAAFETARQVASLPVHPYLSDADLTEIIDNVREVLGA